MRQYMLNGVMYRETLSGLEYFDNLTVVWKTLATAGDSEFLPYLRELRTNPCTVMYEPEDEELSNLWQY